MSDLAQHLRQLTDVRPGMPISEVMSATRLNALMRAVRAIAAGDNLMFGSDSGLRRKSFPNGVLLNIDRIRSGSGGSTEIEHPFQISDVSVTVPTPAVKINVRYGTCQDIEPTDIALDIPLVDVPAEGEATYTVYLDVEVDINGVVIAVTLSTATTGQPDDTDYHGYITLGTVRTSDGAIAEINQAATHSLRVAVCGRVVEGETLTDPGTWQFWGF